jgi:hypothetical protein
MEQDTHIMRLCARRGHRLNDGFQRELEDNRAREEESRSEETAEGVREMIFSGFQPRRADDFTGKPLRRTARLIAFQRGVKHLPTASGFVSSRLAERATV